MKKLLPSKTFNIVLLAFMSLLLVVQGCGDGTPTKDPGVTKPSDTAELEQIYLDTIKNTPKSVE